MSVNRANRLLTLTKTGRTTLLYHVGIASVLRRCLRNPDPCLRWRTMVGGIARVSIDDSVRVVSPGKRIESCPC